MYWTDYRIEAGEMAPDFSLKGTDGRDVRLYDYKNKKTILLFFFNHSKGACLDRLKALARDYDKFKGEGAVIFPVSILNVGEGKALVEMLGLPFAVLCDADHSVVRAYKMGQCSTVPSNVCFEIVHDVQSPTVLIIDTSGIIRYVQAVDPSGKPDNLTLLEECRQALK